MKFSLFSVVALASAAMAAPAVQVQAKAGKIEAAVQARQVADVPVVGGVTETVTSGTITKSVTKKITGTKVTNTGGVVKVLTIAVDETKTQTTSIKQTISKVKAGTLSKAAAITHVHESVSIINDLLTTVVGQLKDLVKIDINLPDVQVILGLVIKLVHEVVGIAKDIVSTLGIDNILASVLELLFRLVATLLGLVTELIGDIVPGVVDILSNVLNTLSGTALGPIITPVSNILDGLTGTLAQGTTGTSA
ncbi:uncharacterized protein B0J16DRAFT_348965 [Fusarium flagelliforme]|uniref:Uncharacterized protein n=1 Tax=Fusarium flagelliforme TaxID=2675880 RepID=A0A395MAU2_9HYPO|nr:uncharacterized protein B0J16DRAFT_348965 [Fusarium flagelliforme]KAH7174685.1 hypothetical protein B0J16DRAFT_348965 [Fusarium flagelliforme]RFN44199.1 hypothetical protein FIE12Z_11591 [Fusarium flagelliforme]